jgi:hypothetical protein
MCGVFRIYQSISENESLLHVMQNRWQLRLVFFILFTSLLSRGEQIDSSSHVREVFVCAPYTCPPVHRNTYYVGPSQYLTQVFFFFEGSHRNNIGTWSVWSAVATLCSRASGVPPRLQVQKLVFPPLQILVCSLLTGHGIRAQPLWTPRFHVLEYIRPNTLLSNLL